MTIQWFPGHMTKAKREMQENLKLVDLVIELRDCRIPLSSKNPMLDEIIQTKPRLIVLSKKDKGEAEITQQWIEKLKDDTTLVIAADLLHDSFVPKLTQACKEVMKEKIERMIRRGIRPRAIRAMVVGVPNVGKSTMINRLAGKKIAQTADRPGVTRSLQWVKLNKDVELLDTPGVLWPKFEDPTVGFHLALTGAIRDEILPKEEVVVYALKWLSDNEPQRLKERYALQNLAADPYALLTQIAVARKHLNKQGEADLTRTIDMVINEIRNDKLGPISWERPA
ncbi:ribosome biogenesis GTPase YlqF [Holdemania filiformis]|uniref:Ribosome biogenesis GTPase A n=1 Tax=Holdemania filiformis TaxID=61171 RepID=A0A412G6U1_9FIRM|nr:ribosome biogenesis GTPase YlqF [Holdemania filiformis]MBS5000365.1 ribosome biogenesis GTPase YlqF [Holdemania filiformis]RGR76966.1 ribosome biogenesis GTPase YlqF [Holdemania filiformis]